MIVLGAGGHAKVVLDTARKTGKTISYALDDDTEKHHSGFAGTTVNGSISQDLIADTAVIAIGKNADRKRIDGAISPVKWETLIHPAAVVADNVEIGEGAVIMAGAIVQPGVRIGRHTIINTGACVDHDCLIGDFVHIAPNCSLAGEVFINEGVELGIGSSVINRVSIGAWSVVGVGSTVTEDIPARSTAFGTPARVRKREH